MTPEWKMFILSISTMVVLGLVLGLGIGFFSKIFYVKEDERVEGVLKRLPGFNCGACGHPGCSGLANAIVLEGVSPKLCKPGTMETFESIKLYLEATPGPDGTVVKVRL